MKLRNLLLAGVAAGLISTSFAFAEDYGGGAIKTADVGGKTILTDASGMTLYTWDKDAVGVSNCYDQCAVNWPPLLADANAVADGEFTLVERTDGTRIWAHEGWPLYLWIKDTKPGDTTGDGVGGTWHTALD